MEKFHVHIYQVVKKTEVDIIAEDSETALRGALNERKNLNFGKSDCDFIAMDFPKVIMNNLIIEKEKSNG